MKIAYLLPLILIVFLFSTLGSFAQKRVKGLPKSFELPVDYFDDAAKLKRFYNLTENKDRKNAWLVISDRDNNPVYNRPSEGAVQISTINFQDYFYVTDEKEDWIEIVSAQVDGLRINKLHQVVGWVPKANMLLWPSGLVNAQTGIHKKAFLLNRADAVEVLFTNNQNLVDIFNDPFSRSKQEPRRIYEYYFVFKKDVEKGMYLLGQETNLSPFNIETKLIGWVDRRRVTEWNTRICLEPNSEPAAFEERKRNPQLRIKAFETLSQAQTHASAALMPTGVFWEDDPATINPDLLASSNPRRYKGKVVRFPMLSMESPDNKDIFKTGIIGTIKVKKQGSNIFAGGIPETSYSPIQEYVDKLSKRNNNVNIFFVIEASDKVHPYKEGIANAIRNMDRQVSKGIPNVRYGALLFRDIPEESLIIDGIRTNRLTEYVPLTPDLEKVAYFIAQGDFINKQDRDDYTALYYGLNQSLQVAGFREDELNIIVLIGNYGDYKADRDRRTDAANRGHRTYFSDISQIIENLSAVNAHLYAIQLRNDGYRPSQAFAKQAQVLTIESAKHAYNKGYGNLANSATKELLEELRKNHKLPAISEPIMEDPNGKLEIALKGGRVPGLIILPQLGSGLSEDQLANALNKTVGESIDFNKKLLKVFEKVLIVGESFDIEKLALDLNVDAGRLAPALVDVLNQMMKDQNIQKQDLINSLDEKYKLYTEAYIPKTINGATYPSISYILFMPEVDLFNYLNVIKRAVNRPGNTSIDKREQLFDIYKELVVSFSGETILRQRDIEDITIEEVQEIIQGVYREGLSLRPDQRIRIGDVLSERKMLDSEVDRLLRRFAEVSNELENIMRLAEEYDFCYRTDENNRYYWIAIEDAF